MSIFSFQSFQDSEPHLGFSSPNLFELPANGGCRSPHIWRSPPWQLRSLMQGLLGKGSWMPHIFAMACLHLETGPLRSIQWKVFQVLVWAEDSFQEILESYPVQKSMGKLLFVQLASCDHKNVSLRLRWLMQVPFTFRFSKISQYDFRVQQGNHKRLSCMSSQVHFLGFPLKIVYGVMALWIPLPLNSLGWNTMKHIIPFRVALHRLVRKTPMLDHSNSEFPKSLNSWITLYMTNLYSIVNVEP